MSTSLSGIEPGTLPTEPVGSIPRPLRLQRIVLDAEAGLVDASAVELEQERAVIETLERFEQTGSPIISDGEQRRQSFSTYPVGSGRQEAFDYDSPQVFAMFADGHHRVLPRLTSDTFQYRSWAADDLLKAAPHTGVPLKQAVVSPSMLSLMYPDDEPIRGYSREEFLDDLVDGCAEDIRRCFAAGAARVSIDFTEGRLALGSHGAAPWADAETLGEFIGLINRVLDAFTPQERQRIGVHTCPGNDRDSAHRADVDYADLIPDLFQIEAGYFLMQAASEKDPERVARLVGEQLKRIDRTPHIFLGVTNPLSPRLESPQEIRDQLVRAARFIPPEQLGSTDDCGFSPYLIDEKPRHGSPDFARDVAFAKIAARVRGTALASDELAARGAV